MNISLILTASFFLIHYLDCPQRPGDALLMSSQQVFDFTPSSLWEGGAERNLKMLKRVGLLAIFNVSTSLS